MITHPPIEHDRYFHIYNRGINSCDIFHDEQDYARFLKLATIFLLPVADIYAYALMRNHFHLALYVKEEAKIGYLSPENRKTENLELKWKTHFPAKEDIDNAEKKKPNPERMVQHFFIAYAKYFNAKRKRTGSLFEYKFKRIGINSEEYLKALIVYIHKNPLKHRVFRDFWEYPYISYTTFIKDKATKLDRDSVLHLFDGKQNFIEAHLKETEYDIDELTFE